MTSPTTPQAMTEAEFQGMLFRLRQFGENDAADLIIHCRRLLSECLPLFEYVACGEIENQIRALLSRIQGERA